MPYPLPTGSCPEVRALQHIGVVLIVVDGITAGIEKQLYAVLAWRDGDIACHDLLHVVTL